MEFTIRAAAADDVPRIIELLREFAEYENLSEYCEITGEKLLDALFGERKIVESLVCFAGTELIAYSIFYPNFSSFRGQRGIYLEDIYIRQEFRGQKIGEKMLREIARFGAEKFGAVRIDFQVLEWNTPAVNFYEKLGAVKDADERHLKFTDENFRRFLE